MPLFSPYEGKLLRYNLRKIIYCYGVIFRRWLLPGSRKFPSQVPLYHKGCSLGFPQVTFLVALRRFLGFFERWQFVKCRFSLTWHLLLSTIFQRFFLIKMTLLWIFLEWQVCPQLGLDCNLPTDLIWIFQMAIGFLASLFLGKNPNYVKRALVRIFNDFSVDLTRVMCLISQPHL
jgi:hypothetical protein